MEQKRGLVIIDVQNDFCSGGTLAIPDADMIIHILNKYIELFSSRKSPIFATRDWHPEVTKHFKAFGGTWTKHCIQETEGAKFHPGLKLPSTAIILSKGMSAQKHDYSAFQALDFRGKSFLNVLEDLRVAELFVGGLATDYCVKESVLNALHEGFKVKLLIDATKGVSQESAQAAVKEMLAHGAVESTCNEISQEIF